MNKNQMIPLERLKPVPLRDAWPGEASHFTPWLAQYENLQILAAALGLPDLAVVATEHWVGDFKVDILASHEDEQVIIENQLEQSDHNHLGQLLVYAAGIGARKIIWVAESFRPEHISALQFLNENTVSDLGFFAAKLELWKIADSAPAPKFDIVVQPDDWSKTARTGVRDASLASENQQLRISFWKFVADRLSSEKPGLRARSSFDRTYFKLGSASGVSIHGKVEPSTDRIIVRAYLGGSEGKKKFSVLRENREKMESILGFSLEWIESPELVSSRIQTSLNDAPISAHDRWEEYCKWISDRMKKFEHALLTLGSEME